MAGSFAVHPKVLTVEHSNPRPHELGKDFDLDKISPFVFDGAVKVVKYAVRTVAEEVVQLKVIAALFNAKREYIGKSEYGGCNAITSVSTLNEDSMQVEVDLNIDFSKISLNVMHVLIALVTGKTFSAARSINISLQTAADNSTVGDAKVIKLGSRRCAPPTDQAFYTNVLVRRGGWWAMHKLLYSIPNCNSDSILERIWMVRSPTRGEHDMQCLFLVSGGFGCSATLNTHGSRWPPKLFVMERVCYASACFGKV